MIDLFDQAGRSLLILGEPGSGKTTMLLELARQALQRAAADSQQPIPVVFNLSSWAEQRPPLAGWLVEELTTKYSIPTKVAQAWVEQDELLLLLDGLDEVAPPHRAACVAALNAFHRDSAMPLVVYSRVADYEALPLKLGLDQAVVLQPLTGPQIDAYLARFETNLSLLQTALTRDAHLAELAQSSLLLSIMALAYRDLAPAALPHLATLEAQRRHLFELYVEQTLARRGGAGRYPLEQTRRWLSWLAARLVAHSQTVFLLERIQPAWLSPGQRWTYHLSVGLMGGLIFGLADRIQPAEVLS